MPGALEGKAGTNHLNSAVAAPAPSNCAAMKPGTSRGGMPLKVSVAALRRDSSDLFGDAHPESLMSETIEKRVRLRCAGSTSARLKESKKSKGSENPSRRFS